MLIVVAAALLDGTGRVLVQRRAPEGDHGGLWEFPGGKVETGERPAEALARELAEELAIAVDPDSLTPLSFATDATGARDLLLLLYTLDRWMGEPDAQHASALEWMLPANMDGLPMPPADLALLAALRAVA